jgi:hypothetical protein
MTADHVARSRRDFLKTAPLLAAVAASVKARTKPGRAGFPLVDGLCLDILERPQDIRAAGLTALVADVSGGEQVKAADGSARYQRTLSATLRSIVATRQKLRQTPDVFLATDGRQRGG